MEVIGTVAATGQLIGTLLGILETIAELRDFLKHAPARCKGWLTEINALSEAILCIRDKPMLQTSQVQRILEAMAPKIRALTKLCTQYAPEPKLKFIKRLARALLARTNESRIIQSFQSLERDKATLLLTISTLDRPALPKNASPASQKKPNMSQPSQTSDEDIFDAEEQKKSGANGLEMVVSTRGSGPANHGDSWSNQPYSSPSSSSSTSSSSSETSSSSKNGHVYKNVDRKGDFSSLGGTRDTSLRVEGFKSRGHMTQDGPQTIEEKRAHYEAINQVLDKVGDKYTFTNTDD
ncbi:hypothetical protein M426DRAFT_126694 [Hypoxylon sp. CI-4A]|nr:hypothetical protein M426DRAFT_126694 [Hypoxylon sp. CI-4A]